jgi:anti-sigma-K factor RskA
MCDIQRSQLIAWVDDELDPSRSALIEAHVNHCAECQAQVRIIRDLTAGVAEYSRAMAEPRRPAWRWAPAAAAAAVLLAAAFELGDVSRDGLRPTPSAPAYSDPHSLPVALALEDLLPIGAAPPGAVIVGELVLDVGGTPRTFRLEGTEPLGD